MSRHLLSAAAALLLLPFRAAASDPGGEFRVGTSSAAAPTVAMGPGDRFLVAWAAFDQEDSGILAQRFTSAGVPQGGVLQVGQPTDEYQGPISAALDARGISVAWNGDNDHSGPNAYFRRFDAGGRPLTGEIYLGRKSRAVVATSRQGISAVLANDGRGITGWLFDRLGRPLRRPFRVTEDGAQPAVAAVPAGFVAVWRNALGIVGGFLDASGERGRSFRVSSDTSRPWLSLAANAAGSFAVAWPSAEGVRVRLYGASGAPRTRTLHVTDIAEGKDSREGFVSAAMDADGRVLVAWTACDELYTGCAVLGRRYESSGAPAGGPFLIGLSGSGSDVAAAAGSAKRFVVVWRHYILEEGSEIRGRRLTWELPGDAPCIHRGNRFLCDLAHDGGDEERALSFGRGGDRPLLGDLDGDGRDDPCVYRDGRVLCDTAHDGGAAEIGITFGQDGDVSLLADLDGEGRDDLCVRRGADLLCDSAHNGGTAELIVHFGEEDDLFLMGDVDGDGDDDPCVARSTMLLCDSEHDGGVAETVIPLDWSGETVLLGDVDADGRDDPCLYEKGRFLCDADHDGTTELVIPFGQPGDQPLLGDPNGL